VLDRHAAHQAAVDERTNILSCCLYSQQAQLPQCRLGLVAAVVAVQTPAVFSVTQQRQSLTIIHLHVMLPAPAG
jgi:hypothetical protein